MGHYYRVPSGFPESVVTPLAGFQVGPPPASHRSYVAASGQPASPPHCHVVQNGEGGREAGRDAAALRKAYKGHRFANPRVTSSLCLPCHLASGLYRPCLFPLALP